MKRITSALLSILLALAAIVSTSVSAHACKDWSNTDTLEDRLYDVIETYPQLYSVEGNYFTPIESSAKSVSTIYADAHPCYSVKPPTTEVAGILKPS